MTASFLAELNTGRFAAFAYKPDHAAFLARRREWFDAPEGPDMVLWWVQAGHIPTINETKARLELLTNAGPRPEAFAGRDRFPAPAPAS